MDINNMRNIVILKNLPSNIVDEAFVVLKENKKVKNLEYADKKSDKFSDENDRENEDDYVVKEAELLISNYISKLEKQDFSSSNANIELIRKITKMKRLVTVLVCFLITSFIYIVNR